VRRGEKRKGKRLKEEGKRKKEEGKRRKEEEGFQGVERNSLNQRHKDNRQPTTSSPENHQPTTLPRTTTNVPAAWPPRSTTTRS
jgi:hypothetical protein